MGIQMFTDVSSSSAPKVELPQFDGGETPNGSNGGRRSTLLVGDTGGILDILRIGVVCWRRRNLVGVLFSQIASRKLVRIHHGRAYQVLPQSAPDPGATLVPHTADGLCGRICEEICGIA